MLLANKLAMAHLPLPSVVSFIQIVFAAVLILVMKQLGLPIDPLDEKVFKAYLMYTVVFVLAIYANMQALSTSNVETVIVFRALSPLVVSLLEYALMNRDLPTVRSAISLTVVAVGAIIYCTSDSQFALNGMGSYTWAFLYLIFITIEMTYGKQITSTVKMDSVWAPVLYCNLFAALPMFMLGYVKGDFNGLGPKLASLSASGLGILLFSCMAGTLIG
jgi:GDP-mannose transporter